MAAKLDEHARRLRAMTPAQLADEVGGVKAAIAGASEFLDTLKAELIRRELLEASGQFFDVTLTPPGLRAGSVDRELLGQVMGAQFVAHFSKPPFETSWMLRCVARKAA
jgi:hypothetical protein